MTHTRVRFGWLLAATCLSLQSPAVAQTEPAPAKHRHARPSRMHRRHKVAASPATPAAPKRPSETPALLAPTLPSPAPAPPPLAASSLPPPAPPPPVEPATAASAPPQSGAQAQPFERPHDVARPAKTKTFGSNAWGGRGLYRAISASSMPRHNLVLTIGDSYFSSHNFIVPGDTDSQSTQQMHLAVSPITGLELGLSQYALVNTYQDASVRVLQVLGNPWVHLKYGHSLGPRLALGIYAGLRLPTSQGGKGLQLSAFSLPLNMLVSYRLNDRVEFTGNLGYTLDRSSNFDASRTPDTVARFFYEINKTQQLTYALGAQARLNAADVVDFAPYIEMTGGMGFGAAATRQNAPFRGTLGLKVYPTQSRSIEISGGADLRLGGEPQQNSPFAGVPPWLIFGQVSFHVNTRRAVLPDCSTHAPQNCQTAADCGFGLSCVVNRCTLMQNDNNHATFVIAGAVVDSTTAEPVSGARLTFSDFENTVLAADLRTGQFASWPLATTGTALTVRIEAPGYGAVSQNLSRGTSGQIQQVTLRMDSNAPVGIGSVKGSIKDGHSGKPVPHATVFIPVLAKQINTAEDGSFSADVKVGLFEVLISARHYMTQKKEVRVLEGDVVIINADLIPKRRPRG